MIEHPTVRKLDYAPVEIAGKSVIVTGGTTGIGRATAIFLAAHGAKVLIFGRHRQELSDAMNDLREISDDVHGMTADVAEMEDVRRVFAESDEHFGKLDILINNAGLPAEDLASMSFEEWEYILRSNLSGYLACAEEAVKRMKKHGEGHIVNVGSMSAHSRKPGSSVYVTTKAAIQGFSDSLRKEVNDDGIKVTLIEPGLVGSDLIEDDVPTQKRKATQMKMLKAEDIAACIYYCLTQPARCNVIGIQIRALLDE